jgi:hypothetical protein
MADINDFNIQADKYRDNLNKFDYFFLSVILGSLALSIQYYNPIITPRSTLLIIFSWILFAVSFIAGLLRREKSNTYFYVEIQNLDNPERIDRFKAALDDQIVMKKSDGSIWTKSDLSKELGKYLKMEESSGKLLQIYSKEVQLYYQIKKWCFLSGLLMYALYRITNILLLSHLIEFLIIFISIIITKIFVYFYRKRLLKLVDISTKS